MAPRLSGQTSIFGVVVFVSKSLLGIEKHKKLEKIAILTRKPRSHFKNVDISNVAYYVLVLSWETRYHSWSLLPFRELSDIVRRC